MQLSYYSIRYEGYKQSWLISASSLDEAKMFARFLQKHRCRPHTRLLSVRRYGRVPRREYRPRCVILYLMKISAEMHS